MNTPAKLAVLAITAAVLLLGAGRVEAGTGDADPKQVAEGEELFRTGCVSCHGMLAKGDGPTGRLLAGGVADLTPALRQKEDRLLLEAISSGMGPMPAFAPALSVDERAALVIYLRDLGRSAP